MIFLWILIGTIGRLVIHIPDVTPLTSLCLLAPTAFSKRYSALIMLIVLILSDVCLHFLDHYAVFGLWTVFNYSGWMAVLLLGFLFSKKPSLVHAVFFTLFSSVFFWIWTNFGTWCTTQLYAHTMRGLIDCYIAALPFLRNSMLGSMVWSAILIMPACAAQQFTRVVCFVIIGYARLQAIHAC